MCNCIETYDTALKEGGYNTEIVKPMMFDGSEPTVVIATRKIVDRLNKGPVTLFGTHCPFCGVAYPKGEPKAEGTAQ